MSAVTVQEIVDALHAYGKVMIDMGYKLHADKTIADRIQSEGIAPPEGFALVPIKTSGRKRQLPTLLGNEPFSAQQLSDRMDAICGCKGKYDCDCTSISSMARIAMWTEHNQALNAAKDKP